MTMMNDPVYELIDLCKSGAIDAQEVLENVLLNFLSLDDANDFAEREYGIVPDEED